LGQPLLLDWSGVRAIDVVVVASVAVGLNGVRLGKGLGYAELEWGILVPSCPLFYHQGPML
jgi:5-formyltetrahydrofolate cyclo-ligase